ncbi:MAG TPA: DUF6263 family protein, partial [Flavisolibacter sp.]|nr:DUF6263 family protein [Flavisolibacter sp.]
YMKGLRIILSLSLIASVIVNQGCSNDSEAKVLKFNLEKGKGYRYTMNTKMNQEMGGQKMATEMKFDYRFEVVNDSADVKTVKATYDRLAMNMSLPNGDVNVDTDQPVADSITGENPAAMMQGMFGAMKGKSFTLKVDAEGNILSVEGITEMAEAMVSSMKVDESLKAGMRQMFVAQFNDESMKQNFAPAFNIYPNKPVKVGDSWDKKVTLQMGGSMSFNTTYTVKKIEGDNVTVGSKSSINIQGVTGDQTGEFVIDAKTGLMEDGSVEQKFGSPMNMTSKSTIVGKPL